MRRDIDFKSDLFGAKIHVLKNGLKIYLSSNKEIPRIYTSIAVKAGSKNDPQHASGIAHYLEHMMFKATKNYKSGENTEKTAFRLQLFEPRETLLRRSAAGGFP